MANHKQAMKRARQNDKRRLRNRQIVTTMRTYIKRVRKAVEDGDAEGADAALKTAVSALDRARFKGVIHRNQAYRKISRLTLAVNKIR